MFHAIASYTITKILTYIYVTPFLPFSPLPEPVIKLRNSWNAVHCLSTDPRVWNLLSTSSDKWREIIPKSWSLKSLKVTVLEASYWRQLITTYTGELRPTLRTWSAISVRSQKLCLRQAPTWKNAMVRCSFHINEDNIYIDFANLSNSHCNQKYTWRLLYTPSVNPAITWTFPCYLLVYTL